MAHVIAPNDRLDLPAVTDLHAQFAAAGDQDIVLDLSAVTQVGALCLQVMIAAGRAARENGTSFRIENVPEQVLDHLSLMGTTPEQIMECTK